MDLFHDYALLIAVAAPVGAIVGLNVFLWLGGERGTLLLPAFPSQLREAAQRAQGETPAAGPVDETPRPAGAGVTPAAANEPCARDAA